MLGHREREQEFIQIRSVIDGLKAELASIRALRKMNFNPDQPRNDRGRWEDDGGDDATVHLAQGDRLAGYPVDLREEENRGGHTIRDHVAKSPEHLSARVRSEQIDTVERRNLSEGLAVGSFPTLDAATRLVNSTVAQNRSAVDEVASGRQPVVVLNANSESVTGYEAFAATERSQPYLRDTYGIRVVLLRDTTSPNGFRVHSAFPTRRSN